MAASSGRDGIFIPDKNTILEQVFTEAIQSNFNSVQKWISWKEEHENLKKTLRELPNKLSHPGVIPFGSRALVKADIMHTNEILSCVGDGYFIKQSAKQAIDMCDRRIKQSEKMLEDLEKECALIKSRQSLPKTEEAFASEDQEEIIEDYDEEKEAQWRVRHREMEKKYHLELAELRKKRQEEGPPQTEEDLFRRLDLLELEEELNDELERLNAEANSDESDEESREETESEEESEKKDSQEKDIKKSNRQIPVTSLSRETLSVIDNTTTNFEGFQKVPKNSPVLQPGQVSYGFTDNEGNQWQKPVVTNHEEDETPAVSALQKSRKSVSFASDDDEPDTETNEEDDPNINIRFKHSSNEFQAPPTTQTTESGDIIQINSPKDIYKQFAHCITSSEPKSILKKNSFYEGESSACTRTPPSRKPFGSSVGLKWQHEHEDEDDAQCSPQPVRDLSHLPPVLQDVLETNASDPLVPQARPIESIRPVSRFKASRAATQGRR